MDGLRKRIERAEAIVGSVDAFEAKLRALAPRIHADPEVLIRVAKGHEQALDREIGDDGLITLSGLGYVCDLLRSERPRG